MCFLFAQHEISLQKKKKKKKHIPFIGGVVCVKESNGGRVSMWRSKTTHVTSLHMHMQVHVPSLT